MEQVEQYIKENEYLYKARKDDIKTHIINYTNIYNLKSIYNDFEETGDDEFDEHLVDKYQRRLFNDILKIAKSV